MPKAPPACLHAALSYLDRGWSPIPLCPPDHQGVSGLHESQCKSAGKAPLWPWTKYQVERATAKELTLYWSRNPAANVGVCMGAVSGLVGIDIDGVEGVELLEAIAGEVPETLCFVTPGGPSRRRLLFTHPNCELPNKSLRVGGKEALRILAKGSQTVMPPSRHASGGTYQWLFEGAIAPFPALQV
jgi:Bifunctional DNA primase/polymerase, N-terminal